VLLVLAVTPAWAQGVLVITDADQVVRLPRPIIVYPPHHHHPPVWPTPQPTPPASYKIGELEVQAKLVEQVAQVQVSQSFVNTGSRTVEASFLFPLPYEGAVEQMTLMVDGREYPARLLKADDARRLYEDIVRKNRDPALLEWVGTGLFKTSVFPIPPGARRTVMLRYSQLCRKVEGLTDFLFPLSTAKYTSEAPERVEIRVTIESTQEIKNVYSPTHAVEIRRPDPRHATLVFTSKNEVPSSDFRLLYDVGRGVVSTRVISYRPKTGEDGYFLLLATPAIKPADEKPVHKTVQIVIDRSGSMSGKKIEQVRGALKFVLNNLRPGDLFNIIAYDTQIETFRPELQRFDDDTRRAALGFVEGLYAGGSTNIDGALKTALGQLQDSRQPAYVFFLTDGLPTAGECHESQIVANAQQYNRVRARLFNFGVGYDVNSRLLEKMARETFGQVEYVRPNEDIEDRISRLYHRIDLPVLTEVKLAFDVEGMRPEDGLPVSRVYPRGSFDLFAGEQMVVVGRYKRSGTAKVTVEGKVGSQVQKFDFPAGLVEQSNDDTYAFVEKLWAVRRVGEILDEIDLKGKNDELIRELVELSTRHGILTPYTSFLADESTSLHDTAANSRNATQRLDALKETSGYAGVAQRAMRGELQRAAQAEARPMLAAAPLGVAPVNSMSVSRGRGGQPAAASTEAENVAKNVRNIGDRAFYRRGNQWIDSTLSQEQQTQARRVKQFSDDYFELARRHGRQFTQYVAFDEPVLVNVAGEAYLVEP
jgi:Ca-activated chloride channel family protein